MIFYEILSFFAIVSSFLVVTANSTVISIIWLVAVFLFVAFFLALFGLTYVALTYVIVYIGAIAILFLFVVQLIDQREAHPSNNFTSSFPLALLIGIVILVTVTQGLSLSVETKLFLVKVISIIFNMDNGIPQEVLTNLENNLDYFNSCSALFIEEPENLLIFEGHLKNLGEWFFTQAYVPVIMISIILLLTMIGPIVLCWKI